MKNFFKKLFFGTTDVVCGCKSNEKNDVVNENNSITWDLKIDDKGNVVELSADRELVGKMYDTILEVYGKGDTFKSRSKKIWEACEEIVLTVEPYLGDMESLPFKDDNESIETENEVKDSEEK